METSGLVPEDFVTTPELSEVVAASGPLASVYLTTEGEVHDAAEQLARRWKTVRASLGKQGAGDAVVEAIDTVVDGAYQEGGGLGVIADRSGVLYVEHHPEPPATDTGHWGPLPALVPILDWHQSQPAYAVVLADRHGADLVGVRRHRPDTHVEAGGDDYPMRKVAPGGWSQRRFQQRAENTWEHNADDVANELVALVDRVGARVVAVAGDVRAVQLLRQALPSEVDHLVNEIDGGRTADGSEEAVRAEIQRVVQEVVERQTEAVVAKFAEERGQHDRATEGVGTTVSALAMAQVAGLLIDPAALEGRQGWFGPEPTQLATDRQALAAMGVSSPAQAPLADVVVRAALGTGAGVRVVPSDRAPSAGVGALLRWAV